MSVTFYPNYVQYIGFAAASEPTIANESFTCSGQEESDPAYDLLDNSNNNVVTIDSDSQTTAPTVRIDSTAVIGPDFMIIDAHNFNNCDADITVQYGAGPTTRAVSSA